MKCREQQRMLTNFLDVDLPEKVRREMQEHLDVCEDCKRECISLANSWELLRDYPVPKAGAGFTTSVMTKVCSEGVARKRRPSVIRFAHSRARSHWQSLPALAACVLLVLMFSVLLKGPSSDAPETVKRIQVGVRHSVSDNEIVENLDVYEELEFFEELEVFADLDVIERIEDTI